jgi:selenium metabolism protein YedF
MLCPKPLIMVKAAMEKMQIGQSLTVLLDNQIACDNVIRFLQDHQAVPQRQQRDGIYVLTAVKSAIEPTAPAEMWCAPTGQTHRPVVVIGCDRMGHGSDELGRILIQAAVNTLEQMRPVPSAVIFYNAGIHLTCEGSPVLDALAALERQGVKLLVCGTCLEYFNRRSDRKAGVVSNMYDILLTLSGGGAVIKL